MTSSDDLARARRALADRFANAHGVNGFGIGPKITKGSATGEMAVAVFVTRKRPKSYIPPNALLPSHVEVRGKKVSVDVVEGGPFYPLIALSLADETRSTSMTTTTIEDVFTARVRPVPFGVSVGHYAITAGTVGGLVTDNTDGSIQVLSNNHVLANCNDAAPGDEILQPGPSDSGTTSGDVVAHLKRFAPISYTSVNRVDAAIAAPASTGMFVNSAAVATVSPIGPNHLAVGLLFAGDCSGRIFACKASDVASQLNVAFPGGHVEPSCGMIVEKVGRTTGWTANVIAHTDVSMGVRYPGGLAQFEGLFSVPGFGHAGDSGSLVVRAED